jgi:hypothetical protein
MAPKRTRHRVTDAAGKKRGRDDADQADQPYFITSQWKLKLMEAEWKNCFHYGLEILGEDERICSYAAAGTKAFFMAYTTMFDLFRICFPFSNFQIEVLHNLHLAPS